MGLEKDSLSSETCLVLCCGCYLQSSTNSPALWGAGVRALGVLGFGGKVGLRVQEADGLEVMVLGILFLKMRWEPASESE